MIDYIDNDTEFTSTLYGDDTTRVHAVTRLKGVTL